MWIGPTDRPTVQMHAVYLKIPISNKAKPERLCVYRETEKKHVRTERTCIRIVNWQQNVQTIWLEHVLRFMWIPSDAWYDMLHGECQCDMSDVACANKLSSQFDKQRETVQACHVNGWAENYAMLGLQCDKFVRDCYFIFIETRFVMPFFKYFGDALAEFMYMKLFICKSFVPLGLNDEWNTAHSLEF